LADFVALYRGRTVAEAELIAVSAEPRLVRRFFSALLGDLEAKEETENLKHTSPTREVLHGDN
jgi:hypothetical protein